MCQVSGLFEYWRGDIIFRFYFIKSAYHRGRVIISFDPSGNSSTNVLNTTATTTAVYTTVVDLEETDNVEFRVPYQQALAYLKCRSGDTFDPTNTPWLDTTFNSGAVGSYCNGYIAVRVLNELSAPVAVAPINVLTFVRGADNLEFANPLQPPKYCSYFIPQSQEVVEDIITYKTPSDDPHRSRIYMGERVVSLRPYLRRYCNIGPIVMNGTAAGGNITTYNYYFHKIPPAWGFDTAGEQTGTKIVGTGNAPYNYAMWTPLTWIANSFICYRGSVNWTFNLDAPNVSMANVAASRWLTAQNNGVSSLSSALTSNTPGFQYAVIGTSMVSGGTLTNQQTQSCVSLALPNITNYKFQSTNPSSYTSPPSAGGAYDGSDTDVGVFSVQSSNLPANTLLHRYCGVGTDFNLHFFLNVPTLYYQASVPLAP